ncbi:MAG: hypothetical protein FJ096_17080 [Deltaproteobacteria bacterium]|nr:hypothetical protein [Deltaproteobacteria bacterium]
MPRRAPQPQVRPEPAPAPAPPPPRGPSIATNPALATTTARLIVTVVGGACALSVDGNDRGIGSSLNEPVALGDHEVVCLAGRDRMARRFTVREPANIPVEFRIAAPVPPAAAPSGPVDPRTLPLPLPAKR